MRISRPVQGPQHLLFSSYRQGPLLSTRREDTTDLLLKGYISLWCKLKEMFLAVAWNPYI